MDNGFENCLECGDTSQKNEQSQREIWERKTWEEIFEGVPTAPDTEIAQERLKQLQEQDTRIREEEVESNALFYEIYPQFIEIYPEFVPDPRKKGQNDEDALKHAPLPEDRQCEITLAILLLEVCWCWITVLHCGMTFHGLVGCFIVVWWCLVVNHIANSKKPERHF